MDKRSTGGLLLTIAGIIITIVSLFGLYFLLIYGIPLIIIGLVVMFNKNEDRIEEINYKGGKK